MIEANAGPGLSHTDSSVSAGQLRVPGEGDQPHRRKPVVELRQGGHAGGAHGHTGTDAHGHTGTDAHGHTGTDAHGHTETDAYGHTGAHAGTGLRRFGPGQPVRRACR